MMRPVISVNGLCKRYRTGVLAIDNVSLNVDAGEVLALLGPNGSGKTTLVRQITTELKPTGGTIEIMGIDALGRRMHRIKELMGVVPQQAELFEHLTVEEHLFYFALFRGMDRRSARQSVRDRIQELSLSDHRGTVIKNLSGGLKRRVLVSLALLSEPPILVLDEPSTGLDPESRRALWQVVFERKRHGTTIILTTHYLEEAEVLADRIAILSRGKLIALGTLSQLRMNGVCRDLVDQPFEGLEEVYFRLVDEP